MYILILNIYNKWNLFIFCFSTSGGGFTERPFIQGKYRPTLFSLDHVGVAKGGNYLTGSRSPTQGIPREKVQPRPSDRRLSLCSFFFPFFFRKEGGRRELYYILDQLSRECYSLCCFYIGCGFFFIPTRVSFSQKVKCKLHKVCVVFF